jgi:glutamate synthase domain-containing protein 2
VQKLISLQRYTTFAIVAVLTVFFLIVGFWALWVFILAAVFGALTLLGIHDLRQEHHAILRNYPLLGHLRFLFERIRPEIRQYLIEGDQEEQPFSREQRSLVYQRAKGAEDKRPFGSHERVYEAGYS